MKREVIWAVGLLVVTVAWAALMNNSLGLSGSTKFQAGAVIGFGGPVFVATGLIAGIVYLVTKKPTASMWTWTILLLAAFTLLGIGGAYSGHVL